MSKYRNFLLLVLSGVLLGLAFPPFPLGVLAFVGFVPLLIAIDSSDRFRQTFRQVYLAFFVFSGVANWWVSSWQPNADPYLMASGIALWLGHPLFFAIPVMVYKFISMRRGRNLALFAFPFLWTAFECLHSQTDLSYPWLSLGYTQIYHTPLVQFADITGVWGVSFLIVAINVIFTQIYFLSRQNSWNFLTALRQNDIRRLIFAGLSLLLIPIGYGWKRENEFQHEKLMNEFGISKISVGVIQPNMNPWEKWAGNSNSQVELQRKIQDSLQNFGKLDLAIWSETAIPYYILTPNSNQEFTLFRNWNDSSGTAVISGFPDFLVYKKNEVFPASAKAEIMGRDTMRFHHFNAVLLAEPHNNAHPQIYRKMKLTPFAERVPFADQLTFAISWFEWGVGLSGWGKGPKQFPLDLNYQGGHTKVGVGICIESIYPDFMAGFVREGAEILAVITNDAWFNNTPGPEQHYEIAAMRAIETKRYLARCGNSGISGFITPTGISLKKSVNVTRTALSETLPLLDGKTIFVRFGDWFGWLCTLISVGMIGIARFGTMSKKIN